MKFSCKAISMDEKNKKFICNVLRQGTIKWPGRSECLNKVRRKKYKGTAKNGNIKTVWEYRCAHCGQYFKDSEVEVDHIEEVGPFLGDFNEWIERLYCSQENLQVLCTNCHSRKTSNYNARLRFKRKGRGLS